jgi:hypothetical protein
VLEELINIAEEAPKYFRKQIQALIQLSMQVATAQHLEEETRFLAVELLLTLAEQASPMMRKQKLFLENIVPLALQLMLAVEDVDMDEWNSTTEDDNDGTELTSLDVGKVLLIHTRPPHPSLSLLAHLTPLAHPVPLPSHIVRVACVYVRRTCVCMCACICDAQDALDRLALSIGGKTVFTLAFRADLVPAFLEHQDWHYRHAALACISQIAEGCEKQMKQKDTLAAIVAQVPAPLRPPSALPPPSLPPSLCARLAPTSVVCPLLCGRTDGRGRHAWSRWRKP